MSVKHFLKDRYLVRIKIQWWSALLCWYRIINDTSQTALALKSYESCWSPRCTESVRDWSWRAFLLFISRLWFLLPACRECPPNKWRMPDLPITSQFWLSTKTRALLLSQENSNHGACLTKRTIAIPWCYIHASVCRPLVVVDCSFSQFDGWEKIETLDLQGVKDIVSVLIIRIPLKISQSALTLFLFP